MVRVAEVEKPAAKDDEVLVKVHATTVNRTDCGLRAAKPFIVRFFTGLIRPRVTVLGNEFAGEVEAVGAGVTSFKVGDRVFGFNGASFGAHAEYLTMPVNGNTRCRLLGSLRSARPGRVLHPLPERLSSRGHSPRRLGPGQRAGRGSGPRLGPGPARARTRR